MMFCMRPYLLAFALVAAAHALEPQAYFSQPTISPDGAEIAFISGGDLWSVPARGGEAHLLLSNSSSTWSPHYSPDGKYIAFTSTRTGSGDIYLLVMATGQLKRLTFDDAPESAEGWSRDSQWVYFSSSARDISGMMDIYRVNVAGGTPMQVTADRYLTEYFGAPSPDGQTLAFSARGNAMAQWWRKGHSHLDESEIWLMHEGAPAKYEKVAGGGAKFAWPMWGRDGKTLFYMSDRSGAQNIWQQAVGGAPKQVTKFTDGRVMWPSISLDGRTIAFERDFRIWKLDTESGKSAPVEIARKGAPQSPGFSRMTFTGSFQEMALSPDGQKVAFVAHGEVFAASAKDGGDAARLTRTAAPESELAWTPDSRKLAYVSTRTGVETIFLYDFGSQKETQLTSPGAGTFDLLPQFSPDGKTLAFLRGGTELRTLDLASKQEKVIATGLFERPPFARPDAFQWSPDGKWLAYFNEAGKGFNNLYVTSAAGGETHQVSFLANSNRGGLAWAHDGKYLLFTTNQRTEPNQLVSVDLIIRTPKFREDRFRDLFKEKEETPAKPAAGGDAKNPPAAAKPDVKPVEPAYNFNDIRRRLSLLAPGQDVFGVTVSPDGKTAILQASGGGRPRIFTYSLDELATEPPTPQEIGNVNGDSKVYFTPDSHTIFYMSGTGIYSMNLDNHNEKRLSVTADMDVDFNVEKMTVFEQAWSEIRDGFFDSKYNGADWTAVHATYEPLIAGAAKPDEMRQLLQLMVGELNASHLGVGGPGGGGGASTGRLGLRFDRAEYEKNGHFKVTEVIPLSPADVSGIKVGDTIDAVDGVAITARVNLDEQLERKVGKRTLLTVSGKEVAIMPSNLSTEKNLLYRAWVEANRAYVAKISGGKLGYVHMQDMSQGALDRLHLDLDAENQTREGVVIDLRNNNGGFVNAYALDVFARRPYLRMTERGKAETPARAALGQRALESPTVLVVNQHSLSDAEDFTEGYRALKLGKVVGEPTAGWIIYTSNTTLVDGTNFRIPMTRVRGAAGDDMELHPRPVDIAVTRPVGETLTGKDSQLDAAVKALLEH